VTTSSWQATLVAADCYIGKRHAGVWDARYVAPEKISHAITFDTADGDSDIFCCSRCL